METPGAGPSHVDELRPDAPASASSLPLPAKHFFSIEYPGYVQPTSVPKAVAHLGGHGSLESVFRRGSTLSRAEPLIELRLRPEDPFAHPITGDVVPTNNILLKVRKRKRRQKEGAEAPEGEYVVEAVGVIPKTVRFRSMADYQFRPNMDDPVVKLRLAIDNMTADGILNYSVPPEKEDYMIPEDSSAMDIDPQLTGQGSQSGGQKMKSNLRLIPPPLFSRQGIPQNYNYKANTASVVTTVIDEETGEEKKRLINRMRWKGFGPIAISFADKEVPNRPSHTVEAQRGAADQNLLNRLEELFTERPIWTRVAIFNQFAPYEVREIVNSKFLLPLVSYVFEDGPWRDTQVRLGYDPRKDPNARFYQRLYFRNLNHPMVRPSVTSRRQETRNDSAQSRTDAPGREEDRKSHIFDGVTVTKETAAFQLCDIHDPMLKEMIEDEEDLREACNERDGWYTTHGFERIKTVLRHKFFSLLSGHIPSPEECEALLVPQEGSTKLVSRPSRLRYGKHNMAKGALPPEDVAAQRLMATLDQKAKNFQRDQR